MHNIWPIATSRNAVERCNQRCPADVDTTDAAEYILNFTECCWHVMAYDAAGFNARYE